MVFRLSKPAKAGLCFPKHAVICILIITLIIKVAAELPVTQNFNSSNCWGVPENYIFIIGAIGK